MNYLDRMGDMEEIRKIPSVNIFNNWTEEIPKFCFIVPTYKRADLLRYALDSILAQETDVRFEILVVDDNPERGDETEQMMQIRYNCSGVSYYKNSKNHRQEDNWNKLFLLARAEWLIMLHDDDMLYPDYMKYLLKCMSLYSDQIGGYFPSFLEKNFTDGCLGSREKCPIQARVIKEVDFMQGCILGAPVGMCVRRELVNRLGGVNKNSSVAVDYDFYNRLVRVADVVKMYGYPTGVWRVMNTVNVSQHKETVQFCIEWGDVLKLETLEDCGLGWLRPLFLCYLRAFDRQHMESWFRQMGKGTPSEGDLRECSLGDKIVYKLFRIGFSINRRLRIGNKTIQVA